MDRDAERSSEGRDAEVRAIEAIEHGARFALGPLLPALRLRGGVET
jgi:hypothetical protein